MPKGIICIVSISVHTVKAKLYKNRITFALRVALYRPLVKGGQGLSVFFIYNIHTLHGCEALGRVKLNQQWR